MSAKDKRVVCLLLIAIVAGGLFGAIMTWLALPLTPILSIASPFIV